MAIFGIILIIIALVAVYAVFVYNGFIRSKNRVQEAWADIDVQLKRRYDLIPNLVDTVKGYAGHEQDTLQQVTEARTAAMQAESAGDINGAVKAENAFSSTLKSLFAVAENYPDLKANANFLELQRELSDTENKIQAARRFYNGTVRDFNTMTETFPSNIVANIFSFARFELFDLDDDAAREPVKVEF